MDGMNIRFSNPGSSEATPRSQGTELSDLSCDEASSRLFQEKMEEKPLQRHDLNSGGLKGEEPDTPMQEPFIMGSMSNPLENLFSQRMPVQAEAASPQHEPPCMDIEKIVSSILVSSPEAGGHEVRLTLENHVLPHTEIMIRRDNDGMLSVTLTSTDAASFQTLVAAQGSLKSMLESMEKNDVRVVVSQTAENGREENDTGKRSRGYMQEDILP